MSEPSTKSTPQLHLFTGDGKGKTTAAVGMAIRALGAGFRVDMIQFDKGHDDEEHYSERRILRHMENMWLEPTGVERLRPGKKFRFGVTGEDRAEALRGLRLARDRLLHGDADLLILDEILSAATYKLIEEQEIWELIELFKKHRPRELILTGRGPSQRQLDAADLVTEMKMIKHYFNEGLAARPGIDY